MTFKDSTDPDAWLRRAESNFAHANAPMSWTSWKRGAFPFRTRGQNYEHPPPFAHRNLLSECCTEYDDLQERQRE